MSESNKKKNFSIWLMPSGNFKVLFQEIILSLSVKFKGPLFEPHITLHSGFFEIDKVKRVLKESVAGLSKISLIGNEILFEEEFTKTLFFTFNESEKLNSLNRLLLKSLPCEKEKVFAPHLSLLYKNIEIKEKKIISKNITIQSGNMIFDEIKVIHIPKPILNKEDVEIWNECFSIKIK